MIIGGCRYTANKMEKILSKMTLREKVGQLNQHLYGWECYEKNDGVIKLTQKFKDHVKHFGGVGAIYGLLRADPWSGVNYQNGLTLKQSQTLISMVNSYTLEHGRHNILPFIVEEMPHGHQGLNAICYPVNLAMGATFNPNVYKQQIIETSEYAESMGINIGLFSGLDIGRNSKWGRTEETFGSDPYLASQFTKNSALFGYQDHFRSCLKHFIAQGDPYIGLNSAAVNIGERELNEIHLPAAKTAVANNVKMIMAAYNEIDGVPCHANKQLLTNKLRDEWGFDGVVMADGMALNRLVSENICIEKAANYGLNAGVDLSLWDTVYLNLENAVLDGVVDECLVDQSVNRILKLKSEMGLITRENKICKDVKLQSDELNYQTAVEAVILQKNDDEFLPFATDLKTLIIGDLYDDIYTFLGDYTSFQPEAKYIDLKTKLDAEFSNITHMNYTEVIDNQELLSNYKQILVIGGGTSTREFGAKFADNGALISNTNRTDSGENVDVENIDLPQEQQQVIKMLGSKNIDYGFLLIGGRPYALGEIFDTARGILTAYYNGQKGPSAIGDIICGKQNPSGKNPITLPKYSGYNQFEYNSKQDMRNENFINKKNEVFEFGHGLSYSSINYKSIDVRENELSDIEVEISLENKSKLDCLETVQLYVKKENTIITKRRRELIKFEKVAIKAGDNLTFKFVVSKNELLTYNLNGQFEFEDGQYTFIVGTGLKTFQEVKIDLSEESDE